MLTEVGKLPECAKIAKRANRLAGRHDSNICGAGSVIQVRAGTYDGGKALWANHPGRLIFTLCEVVIDVKTDEMAKAEAAWVQAKRWVRTGVDEGCD